TGAVHLQVPVDVATFLLNEKRTDIAHIEMRHKVQPIIVPNRHLETPAHEIIRLRHDQLTAEDIARASYQMVHKPEEPTVGLPVPGSEKPVRQEAAVKGISPGQPAPTPAPAAPVAEAAAAAPAPVAKEGLFARIMRFLRGEPAQPAVTEVVAEAQPKREQRARGERNGERRGNGGRGRRTEGEGRSSRGERTEAGERPQRAAPQADRAERGERQERAEGGRGRGRGRGPRSEEAGSERSGAERAGERQPRGERGTGRQADKPAEPIVEEVTLAA